MAYIRNPKPQQDDSEQGNGSGPSANGIDYSIKSQGPAPKYTFQPTSSGPASSGASPEGGGFGRYVSLGEYLNQNQGEANRMAGTVAGAVNQAGSQADLGIKRAEAGFNQQLGHFNRLQNGGASDADVKIAGRNSPAPQNKLSETKGWGALNNIVSSAGDRATNLKTMGGVQDEIRNAYGQQAGPSGESTWDAALAQQAGGGQFAQLASKYGSLGKALQDAESRSIASRSQLDADNKRWDAMEADRKRKEDAAKAAAEMAAAEAADAAEEEKRKKLNDNSDSIGRQIDSDVKSGRIY